MIIQWKKRRNDGGKMEASEHEVFFFGGELVKLWMTDYPSCPVKSLSAWYYK